MYAGLNNGDSDNLYKYYIAKIVQPVQPSMPSDPLNERKTRDEFWILNKCSNLY